MRVAPCLPCGPRGTHLNSSSETSVNGGSLRWRSHLASAGVLVESATERQPSTSRTTGPLLHEGACKLLGVHDKATHVDAQAGLSLAMHTATA